MYNCREHDPTGKRTVGVVTKPDRADPGIRDRLEATGADHLRLELGYVAVRALPEHEQVSCDACAHDGQLILWLLYRHCNASLQLPSVVYSQLAYAYLRLPACQASS